MSASQTLQPPGAALARPLTGGLIVWVTGAAYCRGGDFRHGHVGVPIIFYGAGVPRKVTETGGRTVDVAPTLAALAGVRTPGQLDGKSRIAVH